VTGLIDETPRAKTIRLEVPGWPGHAAGQHFDVRLTAEDGCQAQRSYSIASAPDDAKLDLTVERLDDGEVSPYLTEELRPGDQLELRGGRWPFHLAHVRWGPLVLIAGGSGLVPLMAMLRDRAANSSTGDARLLASSRSLGDVLYREELATLAEGGGLVVHHTFTRDPPAAWCGASLGGSTQRCCVRAGPRRRGRRGSSSARHSSSERPTRSSSSATNRPRSEPTDSPRQDDEMNDAAALDRNKRCATARSAVPITHSR
jgi:ferredoxin-NADP reductase